MHSKFLVTKVSGEKELFSQEKLENSLFKAGASEATINGIVGEIKNWLYDGASTRDIYARAFGMLRKRQGGMAARYKLKKAIMELGPTGYPFERFIGEVMKQQGYEVKTGEIVQGICVQHEVDVVATNQKTQCLIECKFHNSPGKISNVKVPLYIRSRMNDIIEHRKNDPGYKGLEFQAWVATNTRFSLDALQYGRCSGLKMLSWDAPEGNSLKNLVEKYHLFPITTLVNLNKKHKIQLTEKGIVLCRQLNHQQHEIDALGLGNNSKRKLIQELESLVVNGSC